MEEIRVPLLPEGFHLDYDLVPLWDMINDLKRSNISKEAKRRLKWMDYYMHHRNVSQTCRYFGIARKTFYYWLKRYDPLSLKTLEEKSRKPHNTRKWEVSQLQEHRIIALRRKYLRYGKEKLKFIYQELYHV